MDDLQVKLIFALIIVIITWIAGFPPFHHKYKQRINVDYGIGEALGCGIFLGAALLHMLPEANHDFAEIGIEYPVAFLGAGLVFLLLLYLEHIGNHLSEHKGENSVKYAYLSTAVLSIHSLLTGAALGSSDQMSTAIIIVVAVLAHKWAASFALAVKLAQSTQSLKQNLITFGIFSAAFPLGTILGQGVVSSLDHASWAVPTFNAFAAGTFLYLGTLHGLTRATLIDRCCNMKEFKYVVLGFLIMAAIATVL